MEKVKIIDEDISDKEWEELHIPANENIEQFLKIYIVPELVAFQISNAYYRGCLCDASFEQHYNSMCDLVNGSHDYIMDVADHIFEILKIKYNLVIVDDKPMKIQKWQ